MHSKISGLSDYLTNSEEEALQLTREIINDIPSTENPPVLDYNEPLYSVSDLRGVISKDHQYTVDAYEILNRVLDGSRFQEFKKLYGSSLITGFGRIYGECVGVLINNGILFHQSSDKVMTRIIQGNAFHRDM